MTRTACRQEVLQRRYPIFHPLFLSHSKRARQSSDQRPNRSVRRHAVAAKYLNQTGQAEATVVWLHKPTGLLCKSRLDWLTNRTICDLKTTRDPEPSSFGRSAARYGYHLQAAFYQDAIESVTRQRKPVVIIAVQNAEPFDVVVYSVPSDILEEGREDYQDLMRQLLYCRETDSYPGIAPDNDVPLELPAWASNRTEDETITFSGQVVNF